jgi:hypothetical protein
MLTLVALLSLGTVLGYWRFRPNPHLVAVKELQKELFSPAGRQLGPDDRRQKFEKLRSEANLLSAAEKQGLRSERSKRRTDEMNRYFGLSKEEKTQFLDDLIAREENRRKEWEARAQAAGVAPGTGGPSRPNGPGGPNGRGTPQERDKRREDNLDSMPATQRAEAAEFRKELNNRRQQLGLPTGPRL